MWDFPNIDPIAFEIGPVVIRWYALAYLSGFLLGWRYCMALARKGEGIGPSAQDIDDFLPWAIAGVILGGRLGYVLFYRPEFYFYNPGEILMLWHGGMSFHGGALGVAVAMVLFAWRRGVPLLRLTDLVSASVPIGLFFGRVANFINGELYGRVTDSSLGMVFPHVGPEPRHPSQLYEAALEGVVLFVILFVAINVKAVRERAGLVTGLFLIFYGVFRGFVEFFREPDGHIGLISDVMTMGQVLCLPMIALGICVAAIGAARYEKTLRDA